MKIDTGRELGEAICDVLGIDPEEVSLVTVHCGPDDVAKVTIERHFFDGEQDRVAALVRQTRPDAFVVTEERITRSTTEGLIDHD
jgi:hypothetical protein